MIKAILIDDEPLAIHVVKEYLSAHKNIEVVAECNDGFAGVKAISEHKPDLVFLDVQMPKISGLEMLELLDEIPPVIFTTAFEEYALKAFEANAVDYLLKPFSKERFDEAIKRFLARPELQNTHIEKLLDDQEIKRIVLKDNGRIRILPTDKISHIEADDDYVRIYAEGEKFLKKAALSGYEQKLPEKQFVRVHRSFIVNIQFITRIDPYEKTSHVAVLTTGDKVPVSRSGYPRLKEVLGI